MSNEEAIKILKRLLQYCIREQLSNYKEAIETVLQELDNYKEGNIVSLKLLEKFYLVNKDKNKQMTLANKELFDNFVSKKAIENILADRERLEKENEELIEVEISASAHNKIEELTRENFKLKTELENKRKEYQDTYKDVREELKELQAKANKYDSLVEKIKEKKENLRKEALEIHSILIKQTKKEYDYMLYKHYLDVIQQIKVLQELLDTEK